MMKKWCIGILMVILFTLSSQVDIKANTEHEEELPGMTEENGGSI